MKISKEIIFWNGKCDSDDDTDPDMYSLWAACRILHPWKMARIMSFCTGAVAMQRQHLCSI